VALQTTGQVRADADRAAAFEFVRDPVRLAECIPGCHDLRELSPRRYAAVLTNKLAFIVLSFNVVVEIIRIEPPSLIEAKINGEAIGLAGRVAATARLDLDEVGKGQTEIRYAVQVGLTGKLGGLGEPVFKATSAEMARRFGSNLKSAIESWRTEETA